MLTGKSRGPRAMRETRTTKASKTDQLLVMNCVNQWENMLVKSSMVKMAVNPMFRLSRTALKKVGEPSSKMRLSACCCASITDVQKFCKSVQINLLVSD